MGVHVPARRSHRRRKHLPKDSGDKGSQDSQDRPGKLSRLFILGNKQVNHIEVIKNLEDPRQGRKLNNYLESFKFPLTVIQIDIL